MKRADRLALAERLLSEVSARHRIDIRSLRDDAMHHHFVKARKEYCRIAYKARIGTTTIAKFLNKDASTVNHHVADLIREKKAQRHAPRPGSQG